MEEECKSACASKSGLILSFFHLFPLLHFDFDFIFVLSRRVLTGFSPPSSDCCATTALFTSANILLNFLPSPVAVSYFPALFPPLKYLLPVCLMPDPIYRIPCAQNIPLLHCLLLIGWTNFAKGLSCFYDNIISPFLWTHQHGPPTNFRLSSFCAMCQLIWFWSC